jgi:hypothetical protein
MDVKRSAFYVLDAQGDRLPDSETRTGEQSE